MKIINQGDTLFRLCKAGIEFHTVQHTTTTMAFSGVMRFKRQIIDNIWHTVEIPAADRIPLAPVYIHLNAESYAKYKLYKYSLLPLFSHAKTNAGIKATHPANTVSTGYNHNKPGVFFTKPFKGNRPSAKNQRTVQANSRPDAQVLQPC